MKQLFVLAILASVCHIFPSKSYSMDKYEMQETVCVVITSEIIPSDVLRRFYSSFIMDDKGSLRGAYIGEIDDYASLDEIKRILTSSGVISEATIIYEGYKPKGSRGCKRNSNWICTLEGEVSEF